MFRSLVLGLVECPEWPEPGQRLNLSLSQLGSHLLFKTWNVCPHLCETVLNLLETELTSVPSLFPEHPMHTPAPSTVILCVHVHLQHLPRCLAQKTPARKKRDPGQTPHPQELMTTVGQKFCLELIIMWFGVGGLWKKYTGH